MKWKPDLYSIYRTIEGKDHHLFVIDIDGMDLAECYAVSQKAYPLRKWDYYRFSGNRSFHLVQKRKGKPNYEAITEEAAEIAREVGAAFSYKRQVRPNIDHRMFHRHQLILGFCVHMKTRKWAKPITRPDGTTYSSGQLFSLLLSWTQATM